MPRRLARLFSSAMSRGDVYLLFVDESGTHGNSHSFILGALAVHEHDAARLADRIERKVRLGLGGSGIGPAEVELHAAEMRNPKSGGRSASPWAAVARQQRLALLRESYEMLNGFQPTRAALPHALFGIVVDRRFRMEWPLVDRERFAYEVLLNKFDVMLKRLRLSTGSHNRGLVIHDRRLVAERDIQEWTRDWRKAAGAIGQIRNLADVPLFADSRATRLLQAADLVAYALYRHYSPGRTGDDYAQALFPTFDAAAGAMHGCVHFTPSFGAGSCTCVPCQGRLFPTDRSGTGPGSDDRTSILAFQGTVQMLSLQEIRGPAGD